MRAASAVSRAMSSKRRTRAYRFSGGTPAFPAQWLYGLYVLSPATNFLFATVASGLRFVLSPVGPTRLRWLGHQHRMPEPHDFAVRSALTAPSYRQDADARVWRKP